MPKNKKTQKMPTPENYIKTRARKLPLGTRYVSPDWEDAGIANVFVSRRHMTGSLTFGVFLIDTYCLGLKDTVYKFNVEQADFEEMCDRNGAVEVDYSLVHNLIYGSIAYADDYGFKPAKDWAITQYLLEEDDERVPQIDINFGLDGKPFYVSGPNDNQPFINKVLMTLERTAGSGNYDFISEVDEGWQEEDERDEEYLDERKTPVQPF